MLDPMERAELTREFANRMLILEDDLDNIIHEMSVQYRNRQEVKNFLNDLANLLTDPR